MSNESQPKGVLNDNYASNREQKRELFFRYRVRAQAVKDAVENYLPDADSLRLVDLGAADGKTLEYMKSILPVARGVGIEYNPDLMACASDSFKEDSALSLQQGDVTNLGEVPDNEYDLATALAVLEHIANPAKVVAEACRILRPGGLFVASSPIPFWDHVAVRTGMLKEDHHECDMYPKIFRKFIEDEPGFELLKYQRFMFAPTGILPYLSVQLQPERAMRLDGRISSLRVLNFLFVNQFVVARKRG